MNASSSHQEGDSPPEGKLNTASDSVIVAAAPEGDILFSNMYAERVQGHRLSELVDDFPMFHLDGRPYELAERQIPRSLAGEEILNEDFLGPAAEDGQPTYRVSCWPVYGDEGGGIVAVVAVTRDVTEERREEESLIYLAGLLDNTGDAVVALDPDWRVTVWNEGAERMYGWTAEEALGREGAELVDFDMTDKERWELRCAIAERGHVREELMARGKGDRTVPVELVSEALRTRDGQVIGFLSIHRDITERRRAEEALRRSMASRETILQSISAEFAGVDEEWRYTYVNAAAMASVRLATGNQDLKPEDVVGTRAWEVFPTFRETVLFRHLERARSENRPVRMETYSELSDRWLEIEAYPERGGLWIHMVDLTKRRQEDEERDRRARQQALVAQLGLRALESEDLDALINDTVELTARALDVELALLAKLSAGGERLSWRAAHGWRTEDVAAAPDSPSGSGSMAGYTATAGQPVISDDVVADERFSISPLFAAANPVSAMAVVIPGREEPFGVLLAAAKTRRSFSEVDVNFVQAAANVLGAAADRSGADLAMRRVRREERRRMARHLHDEPLQELAAAAALAQSPPNPNDELVSTLKHLGKQLRATIYDLRLEEQQGWTFSGLLEGLVSVHAAMTDAQMELDVHDGVPASPLGGRDTEVIRVVGEALTNARRHSGARAIRVSAWASQKLLCVKVSDDGRGFHPADQPARSTAAGIAGMRERANLLRGDLDIRSSPGAGTEVRLEVPLSEGSGATERQVRVLLVEDHAAVREAIAAMFERERDFEVVGQAGSLAEARRMLDGVDVALIDLGLPDGYGGDLISELREANPRAETLVLSASLDRGEVARAVRAGAAATLDKSAHLDEVVGAVRRLQAGETLVPMNEVVELLRFADEQTEGAREALIAIESLTPREREVLQALADGLDSRSIAERLNISVRTERNHVASILAKLGVHSQIQALVLALRHGAVEIR